MIAFIILTLYYLLSINTQFESLCSEDFIFGCFAVTFQRSNVEWNYEAFWVALKSLISLYWISNIKDLL